jgi:type I restriction enzyme S subunit
MKRWPTKPLGELIAIEKGKKAPEVFATPTKTSLRYLQIEDLRPSANLKYCEPFACPRATKFDAIIAWDGANAGTVSCNLDGHIGSTLAILRPITTSALSAPFLSRFLEGNFGYLQKTATGATIPHVSKGALTALQIPVPPLAEQERIVKLLDEADELRKLRAQADRSSVALIPALFHEMFGDPTKNTGNWKRKTFADLLDGIDSGWSPTCHDKAAQPDEWGVLKLGAVTTCQYLDTETKALPEKFAPRPELEVKVGDLLFTRKNTYELVAACAFVFETRPRLMLSDLLFRFRLKPDIEINPVFLWGLLTVPNKRRQVQALAGGSAGSMPNISKGRLMTLPIEVPPLPLQNEFAQRMTEIRELEANQAISRTRLDALFQSMLHRAFNGEL